MPFLVPGLFLGRAKPVVTFFLREASSPPSHSAARLVLASAGVASSFKLASAEVAPSFELASAKAESKLEPSSASRLDLAASRVVPSPGLALIALPDHASAGVGLSVRAKATLPSSTTFAQATCYICSSIHWSYGQLVNACRCNNQTHAT